MSAACSVVYPKPALVLDTLITFGRYSYHILKKLWYYFCSTAALLTADVKVSKAVPLHTTEALEGRGGIAPTHSRPRH
jgi:hypothetical protein